MIIRCYGARGSIPVSGEEYVKYGGDTTCLEIRSKNDKVIIVDSGSGIRRLGERLLDEDQFEYTLIFTHSHLDHIVGFSFFFPLYDTRTTIDIMGCPTTQGNLKLLLSKTVNPPLFPVPFDRLKATINYFGDCPLSFNVDTIEILPINLSHPNIGMGYKFIEDGKTFVFLTDNELGYRHRGGHDVADYVTFAEDADLLVHDAHFTEEEYRKTKTWGHSTYLDALNLALSARVRRFGLFHHNPNRNDTDQDAIVEKCNDIIEDRKSRMECFALTQNTELTL